MSDSPPPSQLRRNIVNAFANYAGRFSAMIAWFFLAPYIVRSLGDTQYGLWVVIGSVTSYSTLLEFGIGDSVTKYVSEYWSVRNLDKGRRLVASALTFYCLIGVTILLLGLAASPFLPAVFDLSESDYRVASWLLVLFSLRISLAIPFTTAPAIIRGLQRFDLLNLVNIFGTLFSTAATVVVLWRDGGAIGLAIINIVTAIVTQIPLIVIVYRLAPELRLGTLSREKAMFKQVFTYSWSLFLLRIGGRLENNTDEIVVSLFASVSSATPYSLALKLSTVPQVITDQFLKLILPMASERHAAEDNAGLTEIFLISSRLTLIIFVAVGANLIILAEPILSLWIGPDFGQYAYLVTILVTAGMFDILLWPAGQVMRGMAKHTYPSLVAFSTGILNLVLSILLVGSLGLAGVAGATLLATILVGFTLILSYSMRTLNIALSQYLRAVILPAVIASIPLILIALLLNQLSWPINWLTIVVRGGLAGLIFLITYLNLPIAQLEQSIIKRILRHGYQLAGNFWQRTTKA